MTTQINLMFKQTEPMNAERIKTIGDLLQAASELLSLMHTIRSEIKETAPVAKLLYNTLDEDLTAKFKLLEAKSNEVMEMLNQHRMSLPVRQNIIVTNIQRAARAIIVNMKHAIGDIRYPDDKAIASKFPVETITRIYTKDVNLDVLVDPIQWKIDVRNRRNTV